MITQAAGVLVEKLICDIPTKRELFSALIMQGICAGVYADENSEKTSNMMVKEAVALADKLIKELKKEGE